MLDYIDEVVTTTGVPPSIRQIGEALGIRSTNGVRSHLKALEKKGYIHRSLRTSRGIAMLDRARDRYPWAEMQTLYPFTEEGVAQAVQCAMEMKCVKATIMPNGDIG